MPNPTKQEFEAVAKHVMETAPAGLSRDDFFGLIDKELARPLDTVQNGPDPESEPGTFAGGFIRSLKKDFLGATLNNKPLQRTAHPQTVGDFLGLLIPQAVNRSPQLIKEMEEAGQAASRGAGSGILNRVRGYWKGVGQDIQGKPTSAAREEMSLDGGARAATSSAAPSAGRDLYDTYKNTAPEVAPRRATPTAPKAEPMTWGGKKMTLDPNNPENDKLRQILLGENPPIDPRISNLPPEPMPPAATDVAKPVGDGDALHAKLMESFGGKQTQPPVSMEMGTPRPMSIKPEALSPEQWIELRRYYGAEKLSQLTGKSAEEIRQMAPGPSRVPMEVEDRLNQNPEGIFKHLP